MDHQLSVTIILEVALKPDADADAAFREALPGTVEFPGNEHAEILADPTRPNTLFFLTRWATEEHYQAYALWRSTPDGGTRLAEIAATPPIVHHFHTYLSPSDEPKER